MGTTMRRIDTGQGGNRVVTRTCAALRPGMAAKASDLSRAARVMQRKFDQRFPQLAGMQMQYQWAGHLCLSLNGVSVAREIEAGVYSGWRSERAGHRARYSDGYRRSRAGLWAQLGHHPAF